MADTLQVGDEGLAIRFTVYSDEDQTTAYDMSTVNANTLIMWLGAPDGEVIQLTNGDNGVAFGSDGSDGIVTYAIEAAATHDPDDETPVFHVDGTWDVQVEWQETGSPRRSTVDQLEVLSNVEQS